MPRLIARVSAAVPAAGLRAYGDMRSVRMRGGVTLALALSGLAAVGLQADHLAPLEALQGLLVTALLVGAGGLLANLVGISEAAAPAPAAVDTEETAETPAEDHAGPREPIGGLRILVAEDNPLNQLLVHALLSGLVEALTIVSDGMEALEALRREDFDLVLMDLNMPHLDGLAALAAVRAGRAGRRDTPVVALTAEIMAGDGERLRAAGFDDHLAKPFRPGDLLAIVARCTGQGPRARRAAA